MIDTVLVAIEDDLDRMRPVFEQAAEIADGVEAKVVLLHVFPNATFERILAELDTDSASPDTLARQNETIRTAAGIMRDRGLDIEIVGATGDPTDELLAYLDAHDIDHVFLGGHRQSPAGKAILGSVSQRVLLSSGLPCTIVVR